MPQQPTVLLIDDDEDMRWVMRNILVGAGFTVAEADAGGAGLAAASLRMPDAVLLDMRMPGLGGDEVLRQLRRLAPDLPVIIVTGHGSIPGAVSAMQSGAFEYITKPFRNEHLMDIVRRALKGWGSADRRRRSGVAATLTEAMGRSQAIEDLICQVQAVVSTDYSVVIQGETGTGKEIVARCLHQHGRRAEQPLVVVDCGTIGETLTNSELFGHEKGAYTGAHERRHGWFEEAADRGTIFLDEIGNLGLSGQKAVLRALEEHTIFRVGGTRPIHVDMRVIAASNDDLEERARAGSFREDLFFRLAEYVITLPPLRTRPEDIPYLSKRFLKQACEALNRPPIDISPAAIDLLQSHRWPGNVRELRNVIKRAVLLATDDVMPSHLACSLGRDCSARAGSQQRMTASSASLRQRIRSEVDVIERDAVFDALERAGGNKAEAARILGVDYKTYRVKLKKLTERQGAALDERP
ncbi:sigma-54 dependent transcriptional regulator [Bradyrhizobium sp. SZCCHNS3004]|uniref:sigma-54-dependent transcriptional regulator n=1 Tax=Bradyrhizobium sp. SZCCHNS3004 TaxID=3057312 RepID=UPI002916C6E0|nr:sigma-54 dependent transcriptional regulator [Bradyrhizobium sp. SZCCHNS3004]